MNILKFGGKSIATTERFNLVAEIISRKSKCIAIIPAIPEVTNDLEDISNYFYKRNPEGANEVIIKLKKNLQNIVISLFSEQSSKNKANEYIDEKIDYIRSFGKDLFTLFEERIVLAQGELITCHLFYLLFAEKNISVVNLSALDFMRIDKNSEPNAEYIKNNLNELLAKHNADRYITQGYICKNAYGEIDDFRKGGNDYSATLIGAAIDADEIQIWTDSNGIYNIDPDIIKSARIIETLSFDEAAELAYFGDKILHPTSILPAKLANIPVRVLSILSPESDGTLISDKTVDGKIKAVATKDNITAIKINSGKMLLAHGFLRKIFEIFEHYKTSIDMLASSEVGVSLTIDNDQYLNEIIDELKRYGTVSADSQMSIICITGDLNWKDCDKSAMLDSLKQLPIRMISYGGSDYNFSFLIPQNNKEEVLHILNKNLFNNN